MNVETHNVEINWVGWQPRERLTCHTCQETLLREMWQTNEGWDLAKKKFEEQHNFDRKPKWILTGEI